MARTKKTATETTLIDDLVAQVNTAEELAATLKELKKKTMERILEAELSEHLGYDKHDADGFNGENSRNGHGTKTVLTESGAVELSVPRDRDGTFEPQLVPKRTSRLKGFDDHLIALYSRGMTVRDIQSHLEEMYEVEVSPSLISRVTDQVYEEVQAWQRRELDEVYPVVYFDGFVVKVRHEGVVRNRTVYVVLGINLNGHKDVLGLWMSHNEGAKFWLKVINELRQRGVQDILIASVDGLVGFPEAIEAVFPQTIVQTCIVHMIRNSIRLVAWSNKKALAKDLKPVYRAIDEEQALKALDEFEQKWGAKYPSVVASWRNNWTRVSPFFEFAPEIRRAIYTTNAIEAVNRQLRKATKTRGVFPTDKAVFKLLWLAIDKASKKWTYGIQRWDLTIQQLAIHFEGRVPLDQARRD